MRINKRKHGKPDDVDPGDIMEWEGRLCIVSHDREELLLANFAILVQVEFINHSFTVVKNQQDVH